MKDRILEMIQIRKKKGIFAKSKVEVQQSAADLYAAVIDDKIAMKIGPGDWSPNTVIFQMRTAGTFIAISNLTRPFS